MSKTKAVIFGPLQSGKTALFNYINEPDDPFYQTETTVRWTYTPLKKDETVELWDIRTDDLEMLQGSAIGIYCVDLSTPWNQTKKTQIDQDIKLFKNWNPNAHIMLVGTMLDKALEETEKAFDQLPLFTEGVTYNDLFKISAKEKQGLDKLYTKLRELIPSLSSAMPEKAPINDDIGQDPIPGELSQALAMLQPDTVLHDQLTLLAKQLAQVSEEKRAAIGREALQLVTGLLDDKIANPETVFNTKVTLTQNFETNCKAHLAGSHPVLKTIGKTVGAIAVSTTVMLLVAAGFMACMALGICAVGLVPVVAAASTALVLGATAGGLTAYGLFKPSPEFKAVQAVAQCANDNIIVPPL